MINLDELQKLAEAATPDLANENLVYLLFFDSERGWCRIMRPQEKRANAAHIAAFSPATCLELIGQLRKARSDLELIDKWVAGMPKDIEMPWVREMGDGEK